jgi:hypothetical protein
MLWLVWGSEGRGRVGEGLVEAPVVARCTWGRPDASNSTDVHTSSPCLSVDASQVPPHPNLLSVSSPSPVQHPELHPSHFECPHETPIAQPNLSNTPKRSADLYALSIARDLATPCYKS